MQHLLPFLALLDLTTQSAFLGGTLTVLKPFGQSVPLGALTATAGTPGTKCLPSFPSNELLPSLNTLYVSQLPKVGVRMSPPLPRIRLFLQFGVKSINFPRNILQLTLQFLNTTIADPVKVANTLGSHFSQISSGSHLSPQFHTLKSVKECTPIIFSFF